MELAVEALIKTYCSDNQYTLFVDTNELLNNFEVEGFQEELMNLVLNEQMYDRNEIGDIACSKASQFLSYLIQQHGIMVSDSCDFKDLYIIANAIYRVQDWEDHSAILRITETSESAEDKFAFLMNLVETIPVTTAYTLIDEVPNGFITALERLHEDKDDEDEEHNIPIAYIKELRALKKYLSDMQGVDEDKVWVFQLFKQGMNFYGTFDFYYSQIVHKFDSEDAQYLAIQYLALLYSGSDSSQAVMPFWRSKNEGLIEKLDLLTKVDKLINHLIVDFDKWKHNLGNALENV